jgi:hypothetical protein
MSEPHSWQPVDLAALGDVPPLEPTISGVSYPDTLSLVYGEPETVKTWLMLILCLEQNRQGAYTVWIDFEMTGATILRRLRDLGATENELSRFIYLRPSEPIASHLSIRADIDELIAEHAPTVVVIDAMAGGLALHELADNKNEDVERFYAAVTGPFRASGACVHIIDHVAKDRETRGRWAIGAQRKLGAVDVGITVEMVTPFSRGRTGLARLRVTKDRHGALPRPYAAELELKSDPDSGRITWEFRPARAEGGNETGDAWKPTFLMEKVSAYLERQSAPQSRNDVVEGVGGKRQYVLQAIDHLVAEGIATEQPGPRNSKLVGLPDRFPVPVPVPAVPENDRDGNSVPGSLSLQGELTRERLDPPQKAAA